MKVMLGFLPQRNIFSKSTSQKGFTLIEVLIALTIIMIMIIAITPLMVFSLKSIADSGNKSKSTISAVGKIDVGIAQKDASIESEIPVKFSSASTAIPVEGGVIKESDISTFLADSPTISLSPFAIDEGYSGDVSIVLIGKRTHFASGNTSITIKDKDNNNVGYSNFVIVNDKKVTFKLTNSSTTFLRNCQSQISVKITTLLSAQSSKNEIVRTTFIVNMPPYIAVGIAGKFIVSDDIIGWTNRNDGISNDINDIIWGNDKYVAIGNSGKVYLLSEGNDWETIDLGIANYLNDIMFTGSSFVVTGSSGIILSSQDGVNWISHANSNNEDLDGVAKSSDMFVAVGNSGTILTSADGQYWEAVSSGITNNLNDIIYDGSRFIAVGNGGCNIVSSDGIAWTSFSTGIPSDVELNGIAYNGNTYIAVGSGGSVYACTNTTTWTEISGISDTIVFNDVIWKNDKFLAVNSSAYIFVLNSDGTLFSQNDTGINNLMGVSAR